MIPPSPLEDPAISIHAWSRFKRQLRITAWVVLAMEVIVLSVLFGIYGMISIHLYIGMALAIAMIAFLVSALMGLVFLSHGTGHDNAVAQARDLD